MPFDAQRASPSPGIEEVAVLVPVGGEPDVVVRAAAPIFDDVDVAFVVDGEVVGVPQAAPNGQAGREVDRCGDANSFTSVVERLRL